MTYCPSCFVSHIILLKTIAYQVNGYMNFEENQMAGIKVMNIMEESADAIEKMVNKAIIEVEEQNQIILDIKITDDNIFLILGDK